MSTPTFVKFSRIRGKPTQVLSKLQKALSSAWHIEPIQIVPLRPSSDCHYGGLEAAGDRIAVDSVHRLTELTSAWTEFAVVFSVSYVPARIYLHIFDVQNDGFALTLDVDSNIVGYSDGLSEPGEWFKEFLTSLTATVGAEVCGYGVDPAYEIEHESIRPELVVDRLRNGTLLEIWYPTFHAISTRLIRIDEVSELVRARKVSLATKDLRYEVSTAGYHVLSILP